MERERKLRMLNATRRTEEGQYLIFPLKAAKGVDDVWAGGADPAPLAALIFRPSWPVGVVRAAGSLRVANTKWADEHEPRNGGSGGGDDDVDGDGDGDGDGD